MTRQPENTNQSADDYRSYVEHPRYGRGPKLSGFNPSTNRPFDAHWHSEPEVRIPNTAIEADTSKQRLAAGPGSHGQGIRYYFDVRRVCCDCRQKFIFFAAEQQYWYEDLGLPLEVNCIRCCKCRREKRGLERLLKQYNELIVGIEPGSAERFKLVSLSLDLIDGGVFHAHPTTIDRIRMWLNRLSKAKDHEYSLDEFTRRLGVLETEMLAPILRHSGESGNTSPE